MYNSMGLNQSCQISGRNSHNANQNNQSFVQEYDRIQHDKHSRLIVMLGHYIFHRTIWPEPKDNFVLLCHYQGPGPELGKAPGLDSTPEWRDALA
jgi:hypothetical protein